MKVIKTAEDVHDAGVSEGVEDLRAAAIIRDESDAAEHRQVVRHGGDIQPHEFGEVGHASLALAEGVHNEETVGVTQGFKDIGALAEVGRSLGGGLHILL